MNSNNTIMSIPKLTGRDNWSNWSFAVRAYLQHEELDECLTREPDCNDPKAMKKDMQSMPNKSGTTSRFLSKTAD
ncbi:unnamed protein product [Colias eurytheme]|nr:unnamed protein product [Colias eurytheme]